ncbi:MAG: DUF4149 domain-containing protein [Halorhodospira halophila]|uniref:DUF4149 domain-containing protein n=1 Tax=Halorhodospira TaxID=85108 RepID=UPI001911FC65|nr:DUF4149 domain-containing protein [Halorhodospira halophila]MCG5532787.1 DUF4149 domain-containing protein [Halorhodospira sp. 9621]MCG5537034.1 DUF4149 domain-containing protein [Halorhodospira sp. 9622]MCG5540986.1 DUF4149 domain-containing protein [Halorhodospira sp. M39old]MCG5542335.1 DUF4149 domain-containing protein [Halorhodospira sp. 9628]MCG5545346.1 DUF4149 domain-containing protein [Halorhodospira sp. M38]
MLIRAAERVALTMLAGALWSVGYIVSPLLFRTLEDTAQAAALVGEITGLVAWIALVCAALLIPTQLRHRIRPLAAHWRLWLLVLLAVVLAVGEFWVRPPMAVLTEQAGEVGYLSALRAAESLYFVASAIALVLVLGGIEPRLAAGDGDAVDTAEQGR